jgi:hypothetical protein
MDETSCELMLLKAVLIPLASDVMPVVVPKAIKATTRAYSTRS